MANGASISLPARPTPSASGISPSAVTSAVISTGSSRSAAARAMSARVQRAALAIDQVFEMRQQQDGIARADAEHRDQPHQRAQRQALPGERQRQHAADQAERQIQHHEAPPAGGARRPRQQHHDEAERHQRIQHQVAPRGLLRRGLAAELHPGARRVV